MNNSVLRYIATRAGEASTWRGIVLLLTVCGLQINPDQSEAIIALGLAVAGAIAVFLPTRLFSTRTRKTDDADYDDDDNDGDAEYNGEAIVREMPPPPPPPLSRSGTASPRPPERADMSLSPRARGRLEPDPSLTTPLDPDTYPGSASPRRLEPDYSLDDTSDWKAGDR